MRALRRFPAARAFRAGTPYIGADAQAGLRWFNDAGLLSSYAESGRGARASPRRPA